MIKFKCARCGAVIKAADGAIGKNVKCPSCQLKLTVPRPKARKPLPPLKPVLMVTAGVVVFLFVGWLVWPSPEVTRTQKQKDGVSERDRERLERQEFEAGLKREREALLREESMRRKDVEVYERRQAEDFRKAEEARRKEEERNQQRFELEEKLRREREEIEKRKDKNLYVD